MHALFSTMLHIPGNNSTSGSACIIFYSLLVTVL